MATYFDKKTGEMVLTKDDQIVMRGDIAYADIPGVNFSSLKHLAVSPLLYRWRLDHPQPKTPALILGTAIHCALLEPGKFDSRFAVYDGTRRGKDWDAWQLAHPGVQSLKPDEMEHVKQTVNAVKSHKKAWAVLSQCRVEEPITWTDAETGLLCKARLDCIAPTFIADLKSTRQETLGGFERDSARLKYHGQCAWYLDGAIAANKLEVGAWATVVTVQNDEPYDVTVRPVSTEALTEGRILYRLLLRKLTECILADFWPGIAPDHVPLRLPAYGDGTTRELMEEMSDE